MAIKEQDKVFYEVADNGDKVINLPVTRANNVEGLGRSANTAYVVGDVVYVDNNKKVALKCTQAGTTSNSELNVSTASIGNVITDGTVKWQVCNRTSDVTSVNGKTGDVVVGDVTDLNISGKTITVTFVGGTTKTLNTLDKPSDMTDYIIESYRNGTEWYEVYKSGKVRQGGYSTASGVTTMNGGTITLLKQMANKNYNVLALNYKASGYHLASCTLIDKQTNSIKVGGHGYSNGYEATGVYWEVEGQGA